MQRRSNPKLILQSLFRRGHRTLGAWMTLIILAESMGLALPQPLVWAQTYPAGNSAYTSGGAGFQTMTTSPRPVRAQVKIMQDVNMAANNARVTLKMREAPIRDVLNLIARQGHFNIVVDKSVDGTISVDLTDVSINKALEYIFTASDLNYTKDGNTMIAFSQTASKEHSLNAKTFKAIPVRYKSAPVLAQQLNSTLLGVPRPGGSQAGVVSDADSNTILVVGTDIDIRLVEKALHELDIPRNRKVYQIRHAQPSYVAQVIAANFFGGGAAAGGGGGAAAGGGGAAAGGGGAAAAGGGGAAAAGGGGAAAVRRWRSGSRWRWWWRCCWRWRRQ
jgi:hypothetical protein